MSVLKYVVLLFTFVAFLLGGCSKSDDQRRFENEAQETPSGITEMNVHGERTEDGTHDPNDWEISPMYKGLIQFGDFDNSAFPYPNPVHINGNINIQLAFNSVNQLNSIEIFAFLYPMELYEIFSVDEVSRHENIIIQAGSIARETVPAVYRILIYDGNENLITYGDIQVYQ